MASIMINHLANIETVYDVRSLGWYVLGADVGKHFDQAGQVFFIVIKCLVYLGIHGHTQVDV